MEDECRNLPITINIEGDIKKIEIIREKCKTPTPPFTPTTMPTPTPTPSTPTPTPP